MHPTPIRPIGLVLGVDEEGYLIPAPAPEALAAPWAAPVGRVVEHYRDLESVHSVFLRGSIPRGTAVPGAADLDYVVLHRGHADDEPPEVDFKSRFPAEFREITHLDDLVLSFVDDPSSLSQPMRFLLAYQSTCVLGPDEFRGRYRYKPGPDTRLNCRGFDDWLEERLRQLRAQQGPVPEAKSVWTMKWLLRVGFEAVMERDRSYTRDLYPCWERFALYFPQHGDEMRQVLDWALNPTQDRHALLQVVERLGGVLSKELTQLGYLT